MSTKDVLPSKKFLAGILGLGVGVVILLVLLQVMRGNIGVLQFNSNQSADNLPAEPAGRASVIVSELERLEEADTDGDGLKDWEEALWGTNPESVDTDGDGVSDLDQITAQRAVLRSQQGEIADELNSDLTVTDQFARDLYTTITVLAQDGKLQENKGDISATVADQIRTLPLYTPIGFTDISFVSDTKESHLKYVESLYQLLERYPFSDNDIVLVMNQAIGEQLVDEDILAIIDKYQSYSINLESLSVPIGLQELHVEMVNAYRYLNAVLEGVLKSDQEPLLAMSAVAQAEEAVADVLIAINNINIVVFGESDL